MAIKMRGSIFQRGLRRFFATNTSWSKDKWTGQMNFSFPVTTRPTLVNNSYLPVPHTSPSLFPFQRSVSEQSEVNNCVYIKRVPGNSFKRVFFPEEIILTAYFKNNIFRIPLSLFSKNRIWITGISNFTGVQTSCRNKIIPNFKTFPIFLFSLSSSEESC